ncbi:MULTISPECIES: hypothetical protein [Bradyrhizobium]|uniref:hypothetical protein n=1 Tax=Bradyrhizobium TaxID=374 RepID=UPI000482F530|nr:MULTISPECIES: hypothetical protein [Bradyrhizobium]MDD1534722.1 hypothetical protein [Bradyrhizobium sp. WBOS8]MDD1584213.1 hypothetical protein [Bradyrhizobium sp. WBOS4]UUO50530.1 hypothetical protein DCM78_28665 [Bradyrhizobium sp. WBOS04]UUO57908.1 hypothetical protein DCM80_01165 [Bradyrhizobium sp. WBOS08]
MFALLFCMAKSGGEGEDEKGRRSGLEAPRDVVEFYSRWADFRQTATQMLDRADLSPDERQTIFWLIQLVDRISEHDL